MWKLVMPLVLALLLWLTGPSVASETDSRTIHVVLVWLKEPGNVAHRAQVIETTRGFSTIPGVEEIRVGKSLRSHRPSVDDSFDIGLYITFSSTDDLQIYLSHPEHKAAQRTILRPLVKKVVIYDFRDEGT